MTKGKGESAEAVLPSKDDLRKTITEILKKVDFNTVSYNFQCSVQKMVSLLTICN